jgi:hypothetical protein
MALAPAPTWTFADLVSPTAVRGRTIFSASSRQPRRPSQPYLAAVHESIFCRGAFSAAHRSTRHSEYWLTERVRVEASNHGDRRGLDLSLRTSISRSRAQTTPDRHSDFPRPCSGLRTGGGCCDGPGAAELVARGWGGRPLVGLRGEYSFYARPVIYGTERGQPCGNDLARCGIVRYENGNDAVPGSDGNGHVPPVSGRGRDASERGRTSRPTNHGRARAEFGSCLPRRPRTGNRSTVAACCAPGFEGWEPRDTEFLHPVEHEP